ncbi:MAG TPA: hypothetical protein VE396_10890 [Xanthobacteraceae bacterium]|jgi:hypothetical protein|nr:hypothetical protein [Xanthobacteraceae bacterium]
MLQPIIPNESRSTALDPELLTAEISLLLDYLSGLPERTLTARAPGHLPPGCETYDDALSRYFPIDERVRGGEVLEPPDLQFLLELRDFLNSRAEPATGASIAFTTLVIRRLPEARKGKADAERAYPEWVPMARALSRTMVGLLCFAVLITLTVATLAAYIYIGNAKATNLADLNAQFKALDEEILREEVAATHPPNAAVLYYCSDVESVPSPSNPTEMVERFHTVAQLHLCARLSDLRRKQDLAYANLSPWFPRDDRALPADLNVVSGYVLPVLMGLLGSMTYVLRRYLRSVGDRLLTPRDLREYIVRLVLGTVFGVAIGFFTSASGQAEVITNPIGALGAPALAFLAGYGVEAVFRLLDGMADQFSAARK